MATVTESDLKELKDLITAGFAKSEANQAHLESRITDLDNRISRLEGTLQAQQPYIQKIPDLAEKIGELKNWKQIALTIGGAFTGAIITYLAKTPTP
jgi:hypothetical protein